jgi:hypothetical protein
LKVGVANLSGPETSGRASGAKHRVRVAVALLFIYLSKQMAIVFLSAVSSRARK